MRASRKGFNLEGSQDRFVVDVGRVWGGPGPLKVVFSYHSGTIFEHFGRWNISCYLRGVLRGSWGRFWSFLGDFGWMLRL